MPVLRKNEAPSKDGRRRRFIPTNPHFDFIAQLAESKSAVHEFVQDAGHEGLVGHPLFERFHLQLVKVFSEN
jgi:hypothetical protein